MTTPSHDTQATADNAKRDAWFVIRGFYYQVQTTVQRWMHLTSEEALQCESSEDIEILRTVLVEGQLQVERVLEQIKVRETLTLRSAAAISTVVRFFETSADGGPPTLWRFVTTAIPGQERGLRFPGDLPGMTAWNASRSLKFDAAANLVVEQQAHGLFLGARQPDDINDELWEHFQLHISGLTPEQFGAAFISRIEWATGSDDVPTLRSQLQVDAVSLGLATEPEVAVLVDLLIAHVFHLLTTPGTKRLLPEDLRRVAVQSLAGRDRVLIDLLETFAQSTFQQLTRIEQTSVQTLGKVDEMSSALQTLLQAVHGARAHPLDLVVRAVDEPPDLPALLTERTHVVQDIESRLQQSTVVALNGAAGMGKTTLAVRVYQRWQGKRHWISLRGLARSDIRAHMNMQLALRVGLPRQLDVMGEVISAYADSLDAGLVVVDDLPNLTSDRRFADYVASLAAAVESRSGRILVTTQASIAERLHTAVREPIGEISVPRMMIDEVIDLMVQAEVPEGLQQRQLVESLVATTSGHPILVAATVRYMRSHASLDEIRLMALLRGDPIKPVRLRTRQSLRDLLPDEEARELLDRLSLAGARFTPEIVFAVAGVYPEVSRPGEILQELIGVWVTRVNDERFELSPLLSGIGVETLAPSKVRELHGAMADTYYSRPAIGPYDTIQVVIHLFHAKQWSRLAGFLLQVSGEVKTEGQAKSFELLSLMQLPKDVPDSDRIGILAAQIRFAQLLRSSEAEKLEREFREKATKPDEKSLVSAFIGWLFIGPLSAATNALLAAEGAVRASQLYAEVLQRQPEIFDGPVMEIQPAPLAWAFTGFLSTQGDVYKMVDFVCALSDEELRSTFVNKELSRGVEIFVGRIWTYELDKPSEQRVWSPVLNALDRLIERAIAASTTRLLFAAQRAKATVYSDQLSEPEQALALLAIDSGAQGDPEELLRRHHLRACVLLDHVSPAASLPEFRQALTIGPEAEPIIYAETARRASEAAAKLEQWTDAIRFAIDAIHALGRLRLTLERTDMITELSWLYWSHDERKRATAALGAAVDYLTSNVDVDSKRFRESFRKTAYMIGWMAATARGERPRDPMDDAEVRSPYVGFASRSRPELASVELPLLPPALLYMQARLEAAVGLRLRSLSHCRQSRAAWGANSIDVAECLAASAQGELAASIGEVDEAVEAGLFGIRHFIIDGQAESGDTFKHQGIAKAWAAAPVTNKQSLERLLFSKAIAAALVGAMMRRLSPLQIVNVIGQLRHAFDRHGAVEPTYWHDLFKLAEIHFRADIPLTSIGQAIAANREMSEHLLILYLALINRPDAAPRDICAAQLACLATFKNGERMARSPLVDFPSVVQETWREIAKDRSFLLNTPRLLREALDEHTAPTVANAARILMAAQAATGLRLDTPSLIFLKNASNLSF